MRLVLVGLVLSSVAAAQQFALPSGRGPESLFAAGAQPLRLLIADVDHDGRGEVAMADVDRVALLRQVAPGSWQSQVVMGAMATAMAFADLDGDGDLDLLLGGANGHVTGPLPFGVLRQDAAGWTWLGQVTAMLGGLSLGFVVGDVDGDGDADVVLGASQLSTTFDPPYLRLYRNDGAGGLVHAPGFLPVLPGNRAAVAGGDLDGDGDLDLVAASSVGLHLLRNDGAGFVEVPGALPAPPALVQQLAVVDFDGDGRNDVVTALGSQGAEVLWNLGNGSFAAQALPASPLELQPVDTDGDGRPELIARDGADSAVLRHVGSRQVLATLLPLRGLTPGCMAAGDLRGRGFPDLLVAGSTGHAVFYGSPLGLLDDPARRSPEPENACKVAADFDGDGDVDIAGVNGTSTFVRCNLGRGRAVVVRSAITLPDNFVEVLAGDFDGDGRPDLLSRTSSGVRWSRNLDGLRFQALAWSLQLPGLQGLAAADVDGDGDLDAVVVDALGARLLVNPGLGNLQPPVAMPGVATAAASAAALRDLDGDGDADLLVGEVQPCGLAVWWNDGSGRFAAGPVLPVANGPLRACRTADVDGDGAVDLIGLDAGYGAVLFRQQAGGFVPMPLPAHAGTAPQLQAFDADADGDVDLWIDGAPPVWLRNDGAAGFAVASAQIGVPDLRGSVVTDVDGDGDQDLLGHAAGTNTWLLLANRTRAATSLQVVRPGGALQVAFAATAGASVLPAVQFALVAGTQVPAVAGTAWIDAGAHVLPALTVPANGEVVWSVAVPAVAALVGADVAVQGLVVTATLGFTDVVDERILP